MHALQHNLLYRINDALRVYPSKRMARTLAVTRLNQFSEMLERTLNMARKQKQNSLWDKIEFANIRLTADQKNAFHVWWDAVKGEWFDDLLNLVGTGWKLSGTYDTNNETFIASLTCRNDRDKNFGICVSSRSDDLLEAMALSIFKITVLYKDQKIPTEISDDSWG